MEEEKIISKYINISYLQRDDDWEKDQIYYESNPSVKRCEASDFGDSEQDENFFNSWNTSKYYFPLYCPDLATHDLVLHN